MDVNIMRKRCEFLVIVMVGAKMAPQWWNSPNKAFHMKTPEEEFYFNPERVYNYMMTYSRGDYY
jgi:hypothetical protein